MEFIKQRTCRYTWVLLFFLFIGVIAGLYLVYQRDQVEKSQNYIENIVDYDAVLRHSSYAKDKHNLFFDLKEAGVTALAIYDRTLKKMSEQGEIEVLKSNEADDITFYGGEAVQAGHVYVFPVKEKYAYFQEVWADLIMRLGTERVHVVQTSRGIGLDLKVPYDSFLEMNLSISRLQAEEVANLGFNVIIRPTNVVDVTKSDVDSIMKRLEGVPNVTGIIFVGKEVLGYPNQISTVSQWLKNLKIPVVGIEATNQLQYEQQAGFLDLAKERSYEVGRVYTISKDELKKIQPEEVAQRFYISDRERNIRYNLFPIFESGKDNKTAFQTSIMYMKMVTEKLEKHGYVFGRASIYPDYKPRLGALFLVMLGSIALVVLVISSFLPCRNIRRAVLFFTLSFLSFIFYFLSTGILLKQILALSVAITAPVGAMVLLMECWKNLKIKERNGFAFFYLPLVQLIMTVFVASIGGIFVASLLGSTEFLMEFELFRGVKLTFVLPVLLTAIAYFQRFPFWKGKTIESIKDVEHFIKGFLHKEVKIYSLLLMAFLAVVAWIFVGRSGHTAGVPVPAWELSLRRFLENALYARPREKEFLIGHPSLMMAVFVFLRRWPMAIHFVLTVCGSIGVGSMVETFAHIRTPVYMSIMRGFDGVLLGAVAGAIAILLLILLEYVAKWYQNREAHYE